VVTRMRPVGFQNKHGGVEEEGGGAEGGGGGWRGGGRTTQSCGCLTGARAEDTNTAALGFGPQRVRTGRKVT